MRKYYILLILISSGSCFSQIQYGSVQYKQITSIEQINKQKDMMIEVKSFNEKYQAAANKITYTLNFNTFETYFFANKILLGDDINFNAAAMSGHGKIKYYQNHKTSENRNFFDSRRTGIVIINSETQYQWTLVNETKTIDQYKCYKATSPLFVDGEKQDILVTAWYAPDIPVRFGPIGYGGLPGLILELQNDRATFFVTKINLNPDSPPEIDKLLSPKAISKEVARQLTTGTLSRAQLDGIKDEEDKQIKK